VGGVAAFLLILFGARITFFLSPLKYWGPVRSSSAVTLVFILIMKIVPLSWPIHSELLFFGGSFIGMSGVDRLSRFSLAISCLIFYLYFYNISPHIKGLGGGLGLGAFLSVVPLAMINFLIHHFQERRANKLL